MVEVIPYDPHFLLLSALVTVVMQLSFFAVAYGAKFDKVTDFAGSLNFVLLVVLTLCLGETYAARQIAASVLFVLSRVWLMSFLLWRVLARGKDDRFDKIRDNFLAFLAFWVFQMLWAFLVSMPIIWLNSTTYNPTLTWSDVVGYTLMVVGTLFEISSDVDKYLFRNNPDNRGKVCARGLWYLSRHPNYFGEICIAWGTWFVALSVFATHAPAGFATLLGPLFTMFILIFGSGIPTGEGKFLARFYKTEEGARAYEAYRRQTPPLIPGIPFLYARTPLVLKRLFCLELPMYEYRQRGQARSSSPLADAGPATEAQARMSVDLLEGGQTEKSV